MAPCRPFRSACCPSLGAAVLSKPRGGPAHRPITWRSRCWVAWPASAPARRCASCPRGRSRWCCVWRWLAGPASGKSPALAPMHAMLAAIAADEPDVPAVPALVWQDESEDWLRDDVAKAPEGWGEACPPSIRGTLRPDEVPQALQASGPGLAARFLYAWPELPPYCPLGERPAPDDEQALKMLRRLHRTIRTLGAPLVLGVDEQGLEAFDRFLARLHAQRCTAEGPEAAWLGKGAGTTARLAGVLEVMAWSGASGAAAPGPIGRDAVEAAVGLVGRLFRPARSCAVRPCSTHGDRTAGAPRGPLVEAQSTHRGVAGGYPARCARPVGDGHRDRTWCFTGSRKSVSCAASMSKSSPRGGPRARRWLVNPALSAA